MIFKNLFVPSYQSSDPDKRIASIAKLDKANDKDKSILHELAFNDESEKVSLAALEKLDSFALWMKSSETSPSARIKKHAQHLCLTYLEQVQKVDDSLFVAFVSESKNKVMLEKLVFNSQRLQQQPQLCLQILMSLQNDNNIRRFFQDHANTQQQLSIIDSIQESKVLTRFLKLTNVVQVQHRIEEKLAHLLELKDKPIKIKQQATLINSRMLALKDAQDYAYLLAQLTELTHQFEQLKTEFSNLDEITSASLSNKYLALKASLQQKLTSLQSEHLIQIELEKVTDNLLNIEQVCSQVRQQIDLIVQNCEQDPDRNIDAEVKILARALEATSEELQLLQSQQQTQAHIAQIRQLTTLMKMLHLRLDKVPKIANASCQAMSIVADMKLLLEQQGLHEKLKQEALAAFGIKIDSAKQAFNQIQKDNDSLLPVSLVKDFTKTLQQLYQAKKQFGAYFLQLQQKCENKLKAVNRMIKDGKFTAAISTFYHVQKLYAEVASSARPHLQKSFENTQQEVSKLQDWQAYIAQPRKPLLIEQVKHVLDTPFEDPYERAEQVKQFRSEWVSLGNLHTQEDTELNNVFDTLIERAFAPCRAFFSALEKQREQNYQAALAIVEQARNTDASISTSQIASTMGSLRSAFSQLGEIDKAKAHKVKRAFNKALKPLSDQIAKAQADNAAQKQGLIDKVDALLSSIEHDVELKEASEQAKALQLQYKTIGFAGKGLDNQLWQTFRECNDALFSRFHDSLSAQKSAQQDQNQRIEVQVTEIKNRLNSASQHADLQFYDESHRAILDQLSEVDESTRKNILSKLQKVEAMFERCLQKMNSEKATGAVKALFALMHDYSKPELPIGVDELSSPYKAWVKREVTPLKVLQGLDRIGLTQVAAILCNKSYADLPIGDESIRKDLQLKMMAAKLETNEVVTLEDVLAAWVSLGPVKVNEKEALIALEGMVITNE